MIGETTDYTMIVHGQQERTVSGAVQAAPGLFVCRMPATESLNNPARWRIGHHEGLAIAEAMTRENAFKGVQILAESGIDWTQDTADLKEAITDKVARDLYAKLSYAWCDAPGSNYMPGDVSHNGTYTDADIEEAAAAAKADGFGAADILVAMSATVPWMGLDTEDFNEAHNRIVKLAGAN
jgi:hypothetical protein